MSRVLCPDCNGTQLAWVEEVLTDCGRCLGRGWVAGPPDPIVIDRRFVIDAAGFVLAATAVLLMALVLLR
jgi:hypothetical protein